MYFKLDLVKSKYYQADLVKSEYEQFDLHEIPWVYVFLVENPHLLLSIVHILVVAIVYRLWFFIVVYGLPLIITNVSYFHVPIPHI